MATEPITTEAESDTCRCTHDRGDHDRWPWVPGAEDWACAFCNCGEFVAGPARVRCDDRCGALLEPQTVDELKAAVEHWRGHHWLHGCSHGD